MGNLCSCFCSKPSHKNQNFVSCPTPTIENPKPNSSTDHDHHPDRYDQEQKVAVHDNNKAFLPRKQDEYDHDHQKKESPMANNNVISSIEAAKIYKGSILVTDYYGL
ncbi:hypothetical protein CsatB_025808 [Cannabis sativa]